MDRPERRVGRATWLWIDPERPPAPETTARAARALGAREVFCSVPWTGPDDRTAAIVAALRSSSVDVSALGGSADWPEHPAKAVAWAGRAAAAGFTRFHLDVEPWTRDDWPARADELLTGLDTVVRDVRRATDREVEVDLPPWLATSFPGPFARLALTASAVTLMGYRDRAASLLAVTQAARRALTAAEVPWRMGVETRPSAQPHTTFFEEGRAVLERETGAASSAVVDDPWFRGLAVHDLAGWRDLRP